MSGKFIKQPQTKTFNQMEELSFNFGVEDTSYVEICYKDLGGWRVFRTVYLKNNAPENADYTFIPEIDKGAENFTGTYQLFAHGLNNSGTASSDEFEVIYAHDDNIKNKLVYCTLTPGQYNPLNVDKGDTAIIHINMLGSGSPQDDAIFWKKMKKMNLDYFSSDSWDDYDGFGDRFKIVIKNIDNSYAGIYQFRQWHNQSLLSKFAIIVSPCDPLVFSKVENQKVALGAEYAEVMLPDVNIELINLEKFTGVEWSYMITLGSIVKPYRIYARDMANLPSPYNSLEGAYRFKATTMDRKQDFYSNIFNIDFL